MDYLSAVDSCFIDRPGGMERVAWDATLAMRDRGHRVAVLCARQDKFAQATSEVDGVPVFRYQRPALPAWHPRRDERAIAAAAAEARRVLGGTEWDIVHMHSPFTGAGVMRAMGKGPRYVFTVHSPVVLEQRINWSGQGPVGRVKLALGQGRLRRLERSLLERSDAIQTLSKFTRDQVQRFHGLGDRVTVVPHWRRPELKRSRTKAEARRELGWPIDARVLFTVRRHAARYGIDDAIRAIGPAARSQRCLFVIAGDGPMRPQLEALAAEQGAGDAIRFVGRLDDPQLALCYEAADLFVLPTRALECFGLITQEALAFGCPVLSTDCCAIPETMEPILPSFIVPAGDVGALRDKVEAFLEGKLIAPAPDDLARYAVEHYDESVILPRLVALLEGESQ